MFDFRDYADRGYNFFHNKLNPKHKRLSSLMIYATDLCDSGCKHCLIWAKGPTTILPFETIVKIMKSKCVKSTTMVGLEGGEFLLHPDADKIMNWFSSHHKNYDLFSNCLKPDKLISAVKKYKPKRLYISLDGDEDTYLHMRGKDGYSSVIKVIESLKNTVPVFVMFTLSPYNDFEDLKHVAEVCKHHNVFLRVGIYNNIPFFDTIENAQQTFFGEHKNEDILTFKQAKEKQEQQHLINNPDNNSLNTDRVSYKNQIPEIIKEFSENYDYIQFYENWTKKNIRLTCNSIMDSLIVLPNGDVPICQNLGIKLGNIYSDNLDYIFNSANSVKTQQHYSANCNQCWVSYHRKYDVILYRTFEKYFGKWATKKMMGYYKWDEDERMSYKEAIK